MGQHESSTLPLSFPHLSRNLFDFKYVIGRGGFGKVWKVSFKKTHHVYALKEMSKLKIIDRKSEKSIISERNHLSKLNHPFLVNMICSFQDDDYLYLVMDLLTGGDLRYHLCYHKRFTEEQTKFFLACLILGLDYIHANKVIHRDIKPENLVLDSHGYIRITDFGVAKTFRKNNSEETSGTPGYMAPEVLCAKNHTYAVDYFALGVIGYEFMFGERPYAGRNRKEVRNAVLSKQVEIKPKQIPVGWSCEAADFINRLIQRKPHVRLGSGSIDEVKMHKWFYKFNWNELYHKRLKSPFVPKMGDNFDKRYCEAKEKINEETLERYRSFKRRNDYRFVFNGYTCSNITPEEKAKITKIAFAKVNNVNEFHSSSLRKMNTNMSTTNTTRTSKMVHNGNSSSNSNSNNNSNKEHKHRNDVHSKVKLRKSNSTVNVNVNNDNNNKNIVDSISHKVLHFNVSSHSPRNDTHRRSSNSNNFKQKRFKLNSGLFSPVNERSSKVNEINLSSMRNLPQIATPQNNNNTQRIMQRSASTFNMFNYIKHIPDMQSPHHHKSTRNNNNNNNHSKIHYDYYNNILSTNRQYINSNNNNIITSRNNNNNTNNKKSKITIMGLSNLNIQNSFRKSSSTSTLKTHTIKL